MENLNSACGFSKVDKTCVACVVNSDSVDRYVKIKVTFMWRVDKYGTVYWKQKVIKWNNFIGCHKMSPTV